MHNKLTANYYYFRRKLKWIECFTCSLEKGNHMFRKAKRLVHSIIMTQTNFKCFAGIGQDSTDKKVRQKSINRLIPLLERRKRTHVSQFCKRNEKKVRFEGFLSPRKLLINDCSLRFADSQIARFYDCNFRGAFEKAYLQTVIHSLALALWSAERKLLLEMYNLSMKCFFPSHFSCIFLGTVMR